MTFQSIHSLDLTGKTVIVRADLNVPAKDGKVTDTTRIDRLKETMDTLVNKGAKVLILSHFGRPDGKVDPTYSLSFLLPYLEKSWGHKVRFASDCVGAPAETLARELNNGEIGLLENVRFHAEEEKNDAGFAKKLAALGDVYVNDAFSAAHRAHASTEGIAQYLDAYAGCLMAEELNALESALENPVKPVVAIAGGSKISTKLHVLNNLVTKTDMLVLGGGMANTFLYAMGADLGSSLCEKDMADEAKAIMDTAKKHGCEIILPTDFICVQDIKPDAETKTTPADAVPAGWMAIDIGPESIKAIGEKLKSAKTLLWNGPVGVFEVKPFDNGTNALAEIAAAQTKSGALTSVAGGGDTVSALENAGCSDDLTYISSAGGAFLEWLEGKTLPGVAALGAQKKAA